MSKLWRPYSEQEVPQDSIWCSHVQFQIPCDLLYCHNEHNDSKLLNYRRVLNSAFRELEQLRLSERTSKSGQFQYRGLCSWCDPIIVLLPLLYLPHISVTTSTNISLRSSQTSRNTTIQTPTEIPPLHGWKTTSLNRHTYIIWKFRSGLSGTNFLGRT
jgi:hypothetical protein